MPPPSAEPVPAAPSVVPAAPAAPTVTAAQSAAGAVPPGSAAKAVAEEAPRDTMTSLAASRKALSAQPPVQAVADAPGGTVRWRVGPGGRIWRSADGGTTWFPQRTAVVANLLAASAPSITTCWAVGTAGTVLLTDDGDRWERLAFPKSVDLVAVDARTDRDATVITRDGRRFTTVDRGAHWAEKRD
jgi:photosystem II stability/assembly factor-like uncharacterized protein